MDHLFIAIAKKVPAGVRKIILEEQFIDLAVNTETRNSPMEYLFDVYEEFIDNTGEFENWTCFKCREHILTEFRRLKPYLLDLQNGN